MIIAQLNGRTTKITLTSLYSSSWVIAVDIAIRLGISFAYGERERERVRERAEGEEVDGDVGDCDDACISAYPGVAASGKGGVNKLRLLLEGLSCGEDDADDGGTDLEDFHRFLVHIARVHLKHVVDHPNAVASVIPSVASMPTAAMATP